jgi:hypothetical protein
MVQGLCPASEHTGRERHPSRRDAQRRDRGDGDAGQREPGGEQGGGRHQQRPVMEALTAGDSPLLAPPSRPPRGRTPGTRRSEGIEERLSLPMEINAARQRQTHDADTHRGHLPRAAEGLPHDEDREQGNDERG